ncbi:MAG TPA: hypothetical protein VL485_06820 [Ktedonobacteraceae bacterium]|jgi:hypothetical protein|nr:hypothetical protein [Ktedonobacteraceae bacterium]
MDQENIDASAGLAFSLLLFEKYGKTGALQAEMQHVPGIHGPCKGHLHLIAGKVATSYLEDQRGQHFLISKEQMIRLDSEKGPFEWMLTPLPAPPAAQPMAYMQPTAHEPVPRRIAALDLDKLQGWNAMQKMMLSLIFEAIDGQRTIAEIKAITPLKPAVIEEGLRILFALNVINISS